MARFIQLGDRRINVDAILNYKMFEENELYIWFGMASSIYVIGEDARKVMEYLDSAVSLQKPFPDLKAKVSIRRDDADNTKD